MEIIEKEIHNYEGGEMKVFTKDNVWTKGIDTKYVIRNDITDKKLWVYEVYWADMVKQKKVFRSYPNFISARFKTKYDCLKAVEEDKKDNAHGIKIMAITNTKVDLSPSPIYFGGSKNC